MISMLISSLFEKQGIYVYVVVFFMAIIAIKG